MRMRTLRGIAAVLLITGLVFAAGRAWAEGFILGETKDELKLKYDVAVEDPGTGRVTVVFSLADEGRLKPLEEVEFTISAQAPEKDGSYRMDLVVSIDMVKTQDGKRVGRVHILKGLAERAEIRLNTHTLDGKLDSFTRLHHVIPIGPLMKGL
jgi:hypothetical protein